MKNKIIPYIVCSLLTGGSTLYAQDNLDFAVNKTVIPKSTHFKTSSIQIEDHCVLDIEGAIPYSYIEFYSSPQGGKIYKQMPLNEKGALTIQFDYDQSPTFALNTSKSVNGSAKGSGFVQYLDRKDCIVKHIEMVKNDSYLNISFESLTNPEKQVSYILSCKNEFGQEERLHTFTTSNQEEWETMRYECKLQPRTEYYFTVISSGKERYSKVLFNADGQNDFIVYPSVADQHVYVEFHQAVEKSPYTITDVKGVVVSQGNISDLKTEIQIGEFVKGTYFIRLDKYPNDGIQFIKQ